MPDRAALLIKPETAFRVWDTCWSSSSSKLMGPSSFSGTWYRATQIQRGALKSRADVELTCRGSVASIMFNSYPLELVLVISVFLFIFLLVLFWLAVVLSSTFKSELFHKYPSISLNVVVFFFFINCCQ